MPPDLQKKFNYDPVAAKSATEAEQRREAQSDARVIIASTKEKAAQAQAQKEEIASQNQMLVWGVVLEKLPDGLLITQCPR